MSSCPICKGVASVLPQHGAEEDITCDRCGKFSLTQIARSFLPSRIENDLKRAKLSHFICIRWAESNTNIDITCSGRGDDIYVSGRRLDAILAKPLPTPSEQADNFILWLGSELGENYGKMINVDQKKLCGVIGAVAPRDVNFVHTFLKRKGYVTDQANYNIEQLTFDGWERYHHLKHEKQVDSRVAFMAMSFAKEGKVGVSDTVFEVFFEPAVRKAGFKLQRVDRPDQPSGSITDFIRVDIRRSRFIIADLTAGNQGAYWEAGFAEGIGIPVFLTCEESYFDGNGTHFDLRPFKTIKWNINNLEKAKDELVATIRATLPLEARLVDPDEGIGVQPESR